MKSTGIIRRIDDLGRIVIPKEIRNSWRINEGDALEIIPDRKEGIIIRKYQPGINTDAIDEMIEELYQESRYANDLKAHDKVNEIIKSLENVKKEIKEAGY